MLSYTIRRILLALPTLFGITLVTFLVINLAPGDPASVQADQVMDPRVSIRVYEQLREYYGLDKPLLVRYGDWLKRIVTLDFGNSMTPDSRKVTVKIMERLPATLSLAVLSLGIGFALAIPIGLLSGARRNGWFDTVSSTILYALYAIPSYVMAIPLILWISIGLDLLPFQGMKSDNYEQLTTMGKAADLAKHYVLITFCFTYGALAFQSRFVRQNLLEVFRQEYILTARAKGVGETTVVLKHAFRNTLIPLVTLFGITFPQILGGSVILEVMFNWPGIGRLFFESILQRDYPTLMALSFITAFLVLLGTLLADLLYAVVDPRVRYD
ncbi:MAG TPA: ABC transporter permease [bacterium]|nr:ABC transporter permease [Candidatus Omnitrophota bacterium]HOJ60324.1 ABC transporter permease [bacterium]HOL94825.1 ABC transporter permease [bacterium]HPO99585.1 ABC transporter permease [bacterium]HXK93457.1 ABC transporter permease [bacterium]